MASVVSGPEELLEPACKRQRLSPPQLSSHAENKTVISSMSEAREPAHNTMVSQRDREAQAGILCFVNQFNPGFSGILKQRYTDFLVNEVTLDGKVVHLTETSIPRRKPVNKTSNRDPSTTVKTNAEDGELVAGPVDTTVQLVALPNPPREVSQAVSEGTEVNAQPTNGFILSDNDITLLDSYFGIDVRKAILNLHEKGLQNPHAKAGSLGSVSSEPITDRQLRGQLHKDMRRIFSSQLETVTDADGVVTITVAQKTKPQGRYGQSVNVRDNGRNHKTKGKLGWQELGGEHLHFSLYKENKDTMEVVSYISSQLKTSPKQFNFAGTKDRRGVTVQRVSVYRVYADALTNLNRTLRGSKVGNFQYEKNRLELGDLMGNEFLITLRDCSFIGSDAVAGEEKVTLADQVVGAAVKNMQVHGFINYYGLQRFGTYAVGTHDVGKMILQGEFEGAVNAILTYGDDALACALDPGFVPADGKPLPRDDIARAHALHLFKTTGESHRALEKLPRKFSGETSIIRYMNRNRRDFVGALMQIPRNLRLMYVHAYQSLVWNMAASERWARYGNKVVKGDLVLVDSESAKHIESIKENEVDENGEIIVLPAAGDTAVSHDDIFQRARALTAEEAASGKYNIFDVVLPTPGYDIEYPDNDIGDYYKEFMTSERGGGLDPSNMRRPQSDFSLSGSYRQLLARIGSDISYEIKLYRDDNEQMVETDIEKLAKSKARFRDRDQGDRSGEARQNHGESAAHESNSQQLNAWKNLPSKLAREEKASADLFEAQKAAESELPKVEVPQPSYKETFIQTSAEHGKRTGHRETTIMPSINSDAVEASPDGKTAVKEEIEAQKNGPAENDPSVVDKRDFEATTKTASMQSKSKDNEGGVKLEIEEDKNEAVHEGPEDTPMAEKEDPEVKEVREKIAVIVKFQLGSSQYATMALRELMKQGGVQTFKPEFGSGR